ncbi:MAG TPA: GAF domain-containing SpoIIE family protein phosphatase [Terriglobales bacterium]|nr:GAF domain-containing SpoIIE family protein phosphatase [Terriglobales bacterium]
MAAYPRPIAEDTFAPVASDDSEGLLLLHRAAREMGSILDLELLIERIVHDVSRWFGVLEANIYLREGEGSDMTLAAVHGCSLHRKGHHLQPGDGIVGRVATTGRMHYAPDVSLDPYYVACEPNTRSEVGFPLKVNGKVIGVFTAAHPDVNGFCEEKLQLLQALGCHIEVAVQNARLFREQRLARQRMDREAQEARQIQEALFPKSSPLVPGYKISGFSVPAGAVGGDWYDFIPLSQGRWGLVLADASGKGTAAALMMSAARGILRSLAENCAAPGEVLDRLNRLLLNDFPVGRFVTMLYAVLDPAARTLSIANAGHPWPLLANGSAAQVVSGANGLPIGFAQENFAQTRIELAPGARVLFYSDGISEAENVSGEDYGSRLLQVLNSGSELCAERVLDDVRAFAAGRGLQDDATVILVKAE